MDKENKIFESEHSYPYNKTIIRDNSRSRSGKKQTNNDKIDKKENGK